MRKHEARYKIITATTDLEFEEKMNKFELNHEVSNVQFRMDKHDYPVALVTYIVAVEYV